MRAREMRVTSWGHHQHADMTAYRPERLSNLQHAVLTADADGGSIAYGDGRNYGDLAMRDGGTAFLTRRLDRIIEFDADTGMITLEAGITFAELHEFAAQRGFLPPVTPGTAFVTMGGGVASDVHGKNHDLHGTLGAHIDWVDIVIANGECVRASPTEHPELFAATIGGCGLTGVIAVVRLRLRRQQANAVETREFRVRDLDQFFELMAEHRNKATYTVGWVDALQRGRKLGRGIFQTGEPVLSDRTGTRRAGLTVPFTFPARTLNRYSVGLFNEAYFRRVPASGRQRVIDYDTFHHPLDSISHWNRLYGRGGFYQFQCVIPDENGIDGVRALLEQVATAGAASFLAVLKTFGAEGFAHLSFPRPGVTLSLDLPVHPETRDLMHRLEVTTRDAGGRIYLAKDATMSAEEFAEMYPRLERFQSVLAEYDPTGRFESDMSRRLKIRTVP